MGRHKHSHWRRRSSSKQLTTSTLAVSALLTRCCCPQSATMCECKVHDFCVLPMNAALLALGGVIAYREKGSEASLYGGLGGAAVLLACTGVSYKTFKEQNGAACKPATAVGLGVSAAVTAGMLTRCGALGRHDKVAIAGVVASTAFTAYYAWALLKDKLKKA